LKLKIKGFIWITWLFSVKVAAAAAAALG